VHSGHEVQLAHPGASASVVDTVRAVEAAGQALERAGATARRPWRISTLPDHVVVDPSAGGPDRLVIGLGGDEVAPLSIPLDEVRRVLVTGPGRSGRSSALVTIGEALLTRGRAVLAVCPRRSPLSAWAQSHGCTHLTQHDAAELVTARRRDPDLCILVDDAEAVDATPVEAALVEAVRLVEGTAAGVIAVGADLERANAAFRGLVPETTRDGCGLVLQPTSPADGDVLGARLDVPVERRPGRGYLVRDGVAEPVQVGRPSPAGAAASATPARPV
jgi:S-DNA-T family DNA segregation ATPase FtsK/SpoIIIE